MCENKIVVLAVSRDDTIVKSAAILSAPSANSLQLLRGQTM